MAPPRHAPPRRASDGKTPDLTPSVGAPALVAGHRYAARLVRGGRCAAGELVAMEFCGSVCAAVVHGYYAVVERLGRE